MTHNEAEKLYGAYQKGSLSREQVKDFHAHLKGCEACQSRFRMQNMLGKAQVRKTEQSLLSPETQAAMARNRDLLVKLLILLILAWAVFKFKR
jgi:hypothetical protein